MVRMWAPSVFAIMLIVMSRALGTILRKPLLYLLSFSLCAVGFQHLLSPDFFGAIIPKGLPNPEWLNVLSGLAEIIIGVSTCSSRAHASWPPGARLRS